LGQVDLLKRSSRPQKLFFCRNQIQRKLSILSSRNANQPNQLLRLFQLEMKQLGPRLRELGLLHPRHPHKPASSQAANEKSAADPVPNGAPSVTDPDAWTETQVLALVQALKAFPKDASQRWEWVAAAVPGKTVVQCKKKVAAMRENFRSKKSGE